VDAERPERDETDDEDEYQQLISDYEHNIESLVQTKNEEMTLEELLGKLLAQDEIM
jgi:hypothetical protein